MEEIKIFVKNRYTFDRDDINLHILYTKFNKIIDHIKIDNNDKFNKIIKTYMDNDNWCYIMSFVCLVAANKQILAQNEEIIYDIVTAIFETNLSITKYRFFSNVLLNSLIIDYLQETHKNDCKKLSPEFVLEEIIENYDTTKSIDRNLDDITAYLNEVKSSKDIIDDGRLLFKGIDSFDEMSFILSNKMKEFNEFTLTYGSVEVFSDSIIKDCEYIKKLKYMSLENQEKALDVLHNQDENKENIPLIERYNSIVNAARIFYNIYGEEKVISVDFAKKA